jgi:hypothetical protein
MDNMRDVQASERQEVGFSIPLASSSRHGMSEVRHLLEDESSPRSLSDLDKPWKRSMKPGGLRAMLGTLLQHSTAQHSMWLCSATHLFFLQHHCNRTEQNRTEQNRTEQNRTEQNRTEQNRTEQNRTAQHDAALRLRFPTFSSLNHKHTRLCLHALPVYQLDNILLP